MRAADGRLVVIELLATDRLYQELVETPTIPTEPAPAPTDLEPTGRDRADDR